ncbi:hypothetical protein [Helicobacter pylori]|uniref:hypothetical protein n=1 Tax=Helicobacter pylori TaxID=210 RepID=UPI0019220F66|nr:hypothetical protein [Helicobacter pylori]QQW61839.1 hypothetical protein HGI43_04120 [Helicobacter pylori]QQW62990.1 hypothetical protein HGI44_02560 [Helicobacter pylori]QQW66236.1 hypothetical protein HGK49_04230 [Helicobacter pylori]QQW67337.1 hypothetical protein HGK50_02260 [Helicobacter pylori]QQW95212.1 hypothetical protein HG559_04150 [Helicobacter pylori]
MDLFEAWDEAVSWFSIYKTNAERLGGEVSTFLKDFSQSDDSIKNAIDKKIGNGCDGFSILVKTAEIIEDYPLVFKFRSLDKSNAWEFIVKEIKSDIERENKRLIEQIQRLKKIRHQLEKHKENPSDEAMLILESLIVELFREGAFERSKK